MITKSIHKPNVLNLRQFWVAPVFAGLLFTGTAACAQANVASVNNATDAQVEANVLKALAGAPELATQAITTRTVYGVVTLSGSVSDERTRARAENLAANAIGVQKVVDELRLAGDQSGPVSAPMQAQADGGQPMVLQSDGTYAPAPAATLNPGDPAPGTAPATTAQRNDPEADQQLDLNHAQQQDGQPAPLGGSQQPPAPPASQPAPQMQRQPLSAQGYPYPRAPYSQQPPYGQPPYQSNGQQPGYAPQQPGYSAQQPGYAGQQPVYGGQEPGLPVTVPSGVMLRVRLNRTLSSDRTPAGTTFDGTLTNDVVANGFIAIPRGASVQGTVVNAKSSGVLKGRGEMSIQLTQVTLGGKVYPIVSDVWAHNGGDKTIETVNKTAGFGAAGALIGALGGGGVGAAIGGGVGAAVGLGSSAASGNGQVYIPAEGMVTFHLAQPAPVQTVSEQEIQRLAYGVPAGANGPQVYRRGRPIYIGPAYYPGYYRGSDYSYGPYVNRPY